MFCHEIIREGAINTSAVALEAEKLLYAAFLKIIKNEAKTVIFSYDYDQEKRDKSYDPKHEWHTDRAYAVWEHARERWTDKRGSGAYHCIYTASTVLTKLVQDSVLAEYGVSLKQDGKNDGVLIDQVYYPIENVKVSVHHGHGGDATKSPDSGLMHRRASAKTFFVPHGQANEDHPKYAGLSVFINESATNDLKERYQDAVLSQIFFDITAEQTEDLDGVDYAIDQMTSYIVPTFTHEYDHLLFYLKKSKHTRYSSRTMLPNKVSGGAYENHVDVTDPDSYARYLASDIELQAWASGEAIRLMQFVLRRQRASNANYNPRLQDPAVWNAAVDGVMAKIKNPPKNWIGHSSEYQRRIRNRAQGNVVVYRKIWQRYLKLLIAKLLQYKKS